MTRRTVGLTVILILGWLAAPQLVEVQQPKKVPRIGMLSFYAPPASPDEQQVQQSPFWQAMRTLGWIEGQTIMVERRWAEGRLERLPLCLWSSPRSSSWSSISKPPKPWASRFPQPCSSKRPR